MNKSKSSVNKKKQTPYLYTSLVDKHYAWANNTHFSSSMNAMAMLEMCFKAQSSFNRSVIELTSPQWSSFVYVASSFTGKQQQIVASSEVLCFVYQVWAKSFIIAKDLEVLHFAGLPTFIFLRDIYLSLTTNPVPFYSSFPLTFIPCWTTNQRPDNRWKTGWSKNSSYNMLVTLLTTTTARQLHITKYLSCQSC